MAIPTLKSNRHTTRAGTELHYLQSGSETGPLILCLHGLGGSTDTFVPLLPHLPRNHTILLLDFPGFGKSPPVPNPSTITVAQYAAHVDDFVKAVQNTSTSPEPGNVIIVGHSLGAIVALQYAAQHPDAVKGLALLGAGRSAANIPAARQRMCDLAAAVRSKGIGYAAELATKSNFYESTPERKVNLQAQDAMKKSVLAADPESYARTCEAMVDSEHRDPQYGAIVSPAVFVAGDKDVISPVERSRDLSALVGGKSWVEVVKSGHQPIFEDVEGVVKAINILLEAVAS